MTKTEMDNIENRISFLKAEIKRLNFEQSFPKTKAEKLEREEQVDSYNRELLSLLQEQLEANAKNMEEKHFNREICLKNVDYLLTKQNKKLGELEEKSGNYPGYLSRMKSGKSSSDPSIEFLMTAAEELNVPLELLVSSDLTEMTSTEEFILKFLNKVIDNTKKDELRWTRETISQLEKLGIDPLMRAWGFTDGNYRVPADAELDALLQTTGWTEVSVDGTTASLPGGFALDLGGIGKGYAAGRCKEILKAHGVTSALLSLGGNVSALGSKPDGTAWTVAIEDPDGGDYLGTVQIADQCVVTSGGYQRYFEQDGVRYWHILDPETGKPARSGMKSVTIVSADDTLADALSTALFVMGPERAADFWRVHRAEFGAVWLTDDGRLFVTEGLTLTTEREYEVVS